MEYKTENTLIKSQKKLSMVIVDEVIYFNNSIGDISAVELNGENYYGKYQLKVV